MVLPKFDDINLRTASVSEFFDPETVIVRMKCRHEDNQLTLEKTFKDKPRLSFGTRVPINKRCEIQNKWNSDNIFFQEIAIKNYFPGTRLGITQSFSPGQGKFNSAATLLYTQGGIRSDIAIFYQNDKFQYNSQMVIGLNNHWIVGAKLTGEPLNAKAILTYGYTLAYQGNDIQMIGSYRNDRIDISLYQKVNDSTEFVLTKTFDGQQTIGDVTFSQEFNNNIKLFGKCDSNGSLWIGLQKRINQFVSSKIFGEWNQKKKSFNRIGIGLEVEC